MECEFPFRDQPKRNQRGKQYSIFSGDFANLPETINEDIKEDEPCIKVRHSRFKEMRDYNEFGPDQKRYRSDERGKRRQKLTRGRFGRIPHVLTLPSANVTETEEEDNSQSSSEQQPPRNGRRQKKKVISLAHFSQLINKRIFSDDFDRNLSDNNSHKGNRRTGRTMSMLD